MKKLVLLLSMCLLLTACGTKESVSKQPTGALLESVRESTTEESQESSSEEQLESTVGESSSEDSEQPYTAYDYIEDMGNLDNLHTDTATPADKNSFIISLANSTEAVIGPTITMDDMTAFITTGMTDNGTESDNGLTRTYYIGDKAACDVTVSERGSVEFDYEFDKDDKFAPDAYVTIVQDQVHDIRLFALLDDGYNFESDFKVDGLDLCSTLQDVLNTYGMPTKTYVDDTLGSPGVSYMWENFGSFTEGKVYISFDAIKTEDGFALKMVSFSFDQKIYAN